MLGVQAAVTDVADGLVSTMKAQLEHSRAVWVVRMGL